MSLAESTESNGIIESQVIFCIGSNCGDRHTNVCKGLEWLSNLLDDVKSSPIYATPDCHGGPKEYLNAVVRGTTKASQEVLEMLCKQYEASCGRDETMRKSGNVPVDIDLVIFGSIILRPNDYKREFFKIGYGLI